MNYSVNKYGKEWAIFCAQTRAFVLFGTKKEMTKRCEDLNKEDANRPTLEQKSNHQIEFFSKYFEIKANH